MKKIKLLAVPALLALSASANAGVIDLFDTFQTTLTDTSDGGFNTVDALDSQVGGVADASIVGGYRDLVVSASSGAQAAIPNVQNQAAAEIGVSGGTLSFNNDTGVTGVAQVQWDGDDSAGDIFDIDYTGLGGIDLTMGNTLNAFELTSVFSDLNWVFEITIYETAAIWTTVSLDATAVPGPTPHVDTIAFSAFTTPFLCGTYGAAASVNSITCGGGGLTDLSNVGALVATLNVGDPDAPDGTGSAPVSSTVSIDLELDSIETVPEPSVLALLGAGLLAGGLGVRRRKAKTA